MPTILISDDEPLTLKGIRDGIAWKDLGLDVVLTAKNGLDALEVLDGREPDILLTDVYMPKMDGIALAKNIHALYPQCSILFLTGYTKKNYLLSAIEVRAEQYINKPVNMEKLYEIIDDIVDKIQERHKIKIQQDQSHQVKLGILLSRISVNYPEIQDAIKAADFNRIYGKSFCCLGFIIPNGDDSSREKGEVDFYNIQISMNNTFTQKGLIPLSYIDQENRIFCFLFFEKSDYNNNEIISILDSYRKNLSFECAVAISNISHNLEESYKLYIQAKERLEMIFYLGTQPVFQRSLSLPFTTGMVNTFTDPLRETIMSGQYDKAKLRLEELREKLLEIMPPVIHVKNMILEIYNIIKNQSVRAEVNSHKYEGEENIFNNISTLDGCIGILIEKINDLMNGHESGKLLAERARNMIKQELHNTNLYITFLSDRMNISTPYLCYLFKRQFGETINHYISRMRIEKAKNLLSSSQLKINEISELCGFSGVNYFITAFKKIAGILPTQYRRENTSV